MKIQTHPPALAFVVCPNMDSFHGIEGWLEFHVTYMIYLDIFGMWTLWDEPTEEEVVKQMAKHRGAPVTWIYRQCLSCQHKTGVA
jgi:hypothetical protein